MSKNRNENKEKNKKNDKKIWLLVALTIILVVLIAMLGVFLVQNKQQEEKNVLAYTDLIKELSYGNIEKIEMKTGSTTVKVNNST